MTYLTIENHDSNIRVVTIDAPGDRVNTLSSKLFDEVEAMVEAMESDASVKGLVIISGKKDTFIAGADLDEIKAMKTPEQVKAYILRANILLSRLEVWNKPVVCAINGACMGGGLELALACDYRIATNDTRTVFALPEVKLGLFPGGGGTHRLPGLIGIPEALPLLLTGKQLRVKKAKKMGLIDEVVHPHGLKDAAVRNALLLAEGKTKKKAVKRSLINRSMEKFSMGRNLIFSQAKKGVMEQTQGLYPAPLEIIESVKCGVENGIEQGIKTDINRFAKLALSEESKNLTHLFFAMNGGGKDYLNGNGVPVKKLAVLGAGLMGHGIAGVSTAIVDTLLVKDISIEAAAKGIQEVKKGLALGAKSGGITDFKKEIHGAKLIPCDDYSFFRGTDMVIEAVFEDLDLKRKLLKDVEDATDERTIFASNTSSLPITEIAKGCKRPENVIGMHYFSPVRSMPLLEIIITDKTADWVLETAIEFGRKQGKTCIVVKDGPAFYTTRILTLMINEAMLLVEEGVDVRTIDDAMTRFGYPVGPITLVDEVGHDVGVHVGKVLEASIAKRRIKSTTALKTLHENGFLGRKNKRGFYEYKGKKGKKSINKDVNKILGLKPKVKVDIQELQHRVSLAMVNEAILCLEEGIIASPTDGDLGAILGLGFPPFRGGPFRYIDAEGPAKILNTMEKLEKKFGNRFKPAELLKKKVREKALFY
jgi:3-hydroxyacyl-CoA dehydrogenase/enoyl-CoA hydratase/3-hydroxybutyryl-CoA epimerase